MEKKISDLTVTEFMALMQACLDADKSNPYAEKVYFDYGRQQLVPRQMTPFEQQVNDYYASRQNLGKVTE